MFKIIFLLRRLPHLTHEQFIEAWGVHHAALAKSLGDKLGMKTYAQVHLLSHPVATMIRESRGAQAADYDGVAEVMWDSIEDAVNVGETAAGIAADVLADEASFIDFENSVMWFGTYHPIIGLN